MITNWDRLRDTIQDKRALLQQRVYFELALAEWVNGGQQDGHLLTGVRLNAANQLNQAHDVALQDPIARNFLERSIAKDEARDRRRRRLTMGIIATLATFLIVAVIGALVALDRQAEAERQASVARTAQAESAKSLAVSESARATAQAETARADRNAAEAQSQARRARAGQLATETRLELAKDNPDFDLALMLAIGSRLYHP